MARVSLLGTPRFQLGDELIPLRGSKVAELLAYLALHATQGRVVSRSRLAGVLWPEVTEGRARRALIETLHRLRRTLGWHYSWLGSDERGLTLKELWVDVEDFQRRIAMATLEDLKVALSLYEGDLLDELESSWLLGPRLFLRESYLNTLSRVCTSLADVGSFEEALSYAQRWVVADPYNEDAYRVAMQLYARLGRHALALQQYEQLARLLDAELQVSPLPETRALAQAIRREYAIQPAEVSAPLLVGRGRERAMLLLRIEQTQEGRGGLVLLEGEAGIGKTVLLEALAEGARWRGLTVVWGSSHQRPRADVYAPLLSALDAALIGPRLEQVCARLSSQEIDLLRGLLPRLRSIDTREHAYELGGAEVPKRPTLAEALAALLAALGDVAAHLIVLDNMQWADLLCLKVLRRCLDGFAPRRLLVVFSYRGDELRARPDAWKLLRELDRMAAPLHSQLSGFSVEECAELAQQQGKPLDPAALQLLYQRSGGNPLFVRELLNLPKTDGLPATLTALLDVQLAALSSDVYIDLEQAAVLGLAFTYRLWRRTAGPSVHTSASELVAARHLLETNDGYAFRNGLLYEHVYTRIDAERRRALHQCATVALAAMQAAPELLAWHYACAGMVTEAAHYYQQAGERMAAQQEYRRALDYYERALAALNASPDTATLRQSLHARLHAITSEASRQDLDAAPTQLVVQLAQFDAPRGRPLTEQELVTVHWTINAGEADAAVLRKEGKVGLRQRRIVRLVAEARAQGALPTDADLARALGVSERTILADIGALREQGFSLPTRRRTA